ncbi:MAG: GNAT family N-acetyltransferase [Candidatus Bathyarchaeota archaeon]|nr:MAG: GNAT family N-acetyltransferase [Candidatus Bathyarchaeota archaeon]
MIHRLDEEDYENVRPLFRELDFNLIIAAVIEHTSPGRIYVDDVSKPRTAFLCSVEGYYLAGNADNLEFNVSLNRLIVDEIFAGDTVRPHETDVAIGFHPDSWVSRMPAIFKGRLPLTAPRRHYVCTKLKMSDWKNRLPQGFEIKRVSESLIQRPDLEVPEHLTDWMKINWRSFTNFLRKGFGFCTLHGNKIVSWSVTDCVSGDTCEIGIRTREDYRRQGLATLTATAAVDHWLSRGGRSVGWHCDENNTGSIGVAEKVGFALERKYVHYYACANAAHHLEEAAQMHLRAKRYREAIESYEKFFSTPQEELPIWLRRALPHEMGTHYFRVAFANAAIGKDEEALTYLDKAIDNGWFYIDYLKTCKPFKRMHGTSAWNRILEKIEKHLNAD